MVGDPANGPDWTPPLRHLPMTEAPRPTDQRRGQAGRRAWPPRLKHDGELIYRPV
jgi:hypothetical protein